MRTSTFTCALLLVVAACAAAAAEPRPNIILLLTDDQGYFDMGCHGNPVLKTPAIDRFANESIEFTRFYASPVCAPTRASLMTGRYNYRTGVTDTWFGRATMAAEEVTLAEALKQASYATALFGKWHLGDTYPYRPEDQGFDEVLRLRGGGMGQPSDPPGNSYFNPFLFHNGKMEQFAGYCMDVYTDAAIRFIEARKGKPFFVYLATNTPHEPLQVSDAYADPYRKQGLSDETAKVYGMVANIDDNFNRLLAKLDELGLAGNTIVVFMSDNGPQVLSADRFTGNLRGEKTEVFEGGVRVPFFIRWPERLAAGKKIGTMAAHIDVMPTLLDACGIPPPSNVALDGTSLMPLLLDGNAKWPNRTLFLQYHRGDAPTLYRNFTAECPRYKLLQNQNHSKADRPMKFELFDLEKDPGESTDIAGRYPELVDELKGKYEHWFSDVCSTRRFAPMPSFVGTLHENPVVLTQQDRRDADGWGDGTYYPGAYWPIRVMTTGDYACTVRFYDPLDSGGRVFLKAGDRVLEEPVGKGTCEHLFKNIPLEGGDSIITAWAELATRKVSPRFLDVEFEPPGKSK